MTTALIGYTGFVGSNLASQYTFDELYNSKNIADIENKGFDLVVCAGVSAVMWLANKEPEQDWKNIESLIEKLKTIKAKKMVLISTVDVYPNPQKVDENIVPKSDENPKPYGKHRLMLEEWILQQFSNVLIVRLPGLFGGGIKKNVIFDIIHDNMLDYHNGESIMQYYNLKNIWKDIFIALDNDITYLNIATQPITIFQIGQIAGVTFTNPDAAKYIFDMQTKHSALYQSPAPGYLYSSDTILNQISEFIQSEKAKL